MVATSRWGRLALALAAAALWACNAEARPGTEATRATSLEGVLATSWDGLEYEVVSRMPEERRGGRAVVFLHGYGAEGASYVPLAGALVDDATRFVLPTAVLPHASGQGAMWWEFFDGDWPKPFAEEPRPDGPPEPSRQLPRAREAVLGLVARVRERYAPESLVIGGHSQGAMLALDVASRLDPPPDRVAAVAGYVLLDSAAELARPAAKRPEVLISHGRADRVVGFEAAGTMQRLLERHGFPVVFRPHDGGHGIESAVVRDLGRFLRAP